MGPPPSFAGRTLSLAGPPPPVQDGAADPGWARDLHMEFPITWIGTFARPAAAVRPQVVLATTRLAREGVNMRSGWIPLVALAAVCLIAPAAHAGFGVGASIASPTGDFGDAFKTGYGVHAVYKQPVTPLVTVTGDFGWNAFSAESVEIGDIGFGGEDVDLWNAALGGRVFLLPLGLGLEYGYFSEIEEWSLVPTAGMSFSKLDVSARWKATGDANWFELRAAFMF
jgi:hypothetical protein